MNTTTTEDLAFRCKVLYRLRAVPPAPGARALKTEQASLPAYVL